MRVRRLPLLFAQAIQNSYNLGPLYAKGYTAGWYLAGGTSAGSPQWAGLIAIASQINGGPVGYINPALYKIGQDRKRYAYDFFDVTVGDNQVDPTISGFSAARGWDPVTGWGTPNAAKLLPDLVRAIHGN